MKSALSWCVVLVLGWVVRAGYAQAPVDVTIDGTVNCTEYSALLQNWVHVSLGSGLTTIRLESSDFGGSPDAENHLVFVLTDGVDPAYHDYWLFTLNGIGDAVTAGATGAYVGFIDTGVSDNHGSSTVSFNGGGTVTVDGVTNCAEIPDLAVCWTQVSDLCSLSAIRLVASDFGGSPDAYNRMAVVLLDGADPSYYDYWLFTLNGVEDAVTVTAQRAWVGFLDSGKSDNHGASTVEFWIHSTAMGETSWGEVKMLFR